MPRMAYAPCMSARSASGPFGAFPRRQAPPLAAHSGDDESDVAVRLLVRRDVASSPARVNGSLVAAESTFDGPCSADQTNLLARLFRRMRFASAIEKERNLPWAGSCRVADSRHEDASSCPVAATTSVPEFAIARPRSFAPANVGCDGLRRQHSAAKGHASFRLAGSQRRQ